jgi:hypothetical protein
MAFVAMLDCHGSSGPQFGNGSFDINKIRLPQKGGADQAFNVPHTQDSVLLQE